jgi:uncharacterized repeat protein (TIGR03806 family)
MRTWCAVILGLCGGIGCRPGPTAPPAGGAANEGVRERAYLNMPASGEGAVPRLLSQTGAFEDVRSLRPANGLVGYEINVAFWADGAQKRRWVSVPAGERIKFAETGEWGFPAGTVFVKHFEMPEQGGDAKRLETRVLVRDAKGGVYGAAYRWRADGSDAELVQESLSEDIGGGRSWFLPGRADCVKCHTPVSGGVLGVNTRQMNRDGQLEAWSRAGLLDRPVADSTRLPRLVDVRDTSEPVTKRARAYLDANCAYCHRPGGAAGNFDARWDTSPARQGLVDGPVLIDLGVDRARVIAAKDPWRSLALVRVGVVSPGIMMPPLGHGQVDEAGVAVLREWVASLPGPPVLAPPAISPTGGEYKQAVRVEMRCDEPGAVIRYTLDGSVPGAKSAEYRGPIEVTEPVTVRARVFKEGWTKSVVVQETFVVAATSPTRR